MTIAIPVYNGGEPLLEAIESCRFINLSHDDFEVLVVNNCSNDGSIEKVKSEFDNFKPLRIIDNDKNYGRIGNWNRCLELADGEFILFLFANDLFAKDNHIDKALRVIKDNQNCSLVNMPWIISNFKMTEKYLPPQFFYRTPGYGYFECVDHIKSVVEMGKLPFVPLQSNIVRMSLINKGDIQFDPTLPITSDGLFLARLAAETNVVGFYEKPSVLWRNDAPNRLHGHLKLNEHNQQLLKSFSLINDLIDNKINLAKAFSKGKGLENVLVSLISVRTKKDMKIVNIVLNDWIKAVKSYKLNMIEFITRTLWEAIKLPLKIKTFTKLMSNRRN